MLDRINALYLCGVPGCFVGIPGVGKTTVLGRFAERVGCHYVHLSASTLTPEALGGVVSPDRHYRYQRRLAPPWVRKPTIVSVDEANLAPRAIEDALRNLVTDNPMVAGRKLKPGSWVCLAMNPPGMGGYRFLDVAMRRRVCLLPWRWTTADVADYMIGLGGLEDPKDTAIDWQDAKAKYPHWQEYYSSLVSGWVRSQDASEWESAMRGYVNDPAGTDGFPSGYGAVSSAKVLAACHTLYPGNADLQMELLIGLIGSRAATSIAEYMDGFDGLALTKVPPKDWGKVIDKRIDRARAQLTACMTMATSIFSQGLESILEKHKEYPELVIWAIHSHLVKHGGKAVELSTKITDFLRSHSTV